MFTNIGSLDVTVLLNPKPQGEYVNSHIVPDVREPSPDYEAMRRLVSAGDPVAKRVNERTDSTIPA